MTPIDGTFAPGDGGRRGAVGPRRRGRRAPDVRPRSRPPRDASRRGRDGPVVVVRHAKAGERGTWLGPDGERPLTRRGRKQAQRLVERFRGLEISRIVSSPFVRCVQTVEPLAGRRGLPVETTDELAEGVDVDGGGGVRRGRSTHARPSSAVTAARSRRRSSAVRASGGRPRGDRRAGEGVGVGARAPRRRDRLGPLPPRAAGMNARRRPASWPRERSGRVAAARGPGPRQHDVPAARRRRDRRRLAHAGPSRPRRAEPRPRARRTGRDPGRRGERAGDDRPAAARRRDALGRRARGRDRDERAARDARTATSSSGSSRTRSASPCGSSTAARRPASPSRASARASRSRRVPRCCSTSAAAASRSRSTDDRRTAVGGEPAGRRGAPDRAARPTRPAVTRAERKAVRKRVEEARRAGRRARRGAST